MKINKKRNAVILLLIIITIMAIVFSMAYFTDHKAKMNVFTVGKVNISLTEEKYDLPENVKEREQLSPREKVVKDPKITNVGESDCFAFFEIYVPRTDRILIDDTGNKLPEEMTDVFLFSHKPQWIPIENDIITDQSNKEYSRFVYAYATGDKNTGKLNVLKKGQSTETLFVDDLIQYKNFLELEEKTLYEIPVHAYAIQTTDVVLTNQINDIGKTDPATVWNVIKAQKGAEERSAKP